MTNKELQELMINTKGRIFSVGFTKKDGSYRKMTCRTGVKKGQVGVGMKYDPISRGLLPVYDLQKKAYRMINMETVDKVKFQKNNLSINLFD